MPATKATLQDNSTRYEGEIQKLFTELQTLSQSPTDQPCSQTEDGRPHSSSSSSSLSSSSSVRLTRRNSVPALSLSESAPAGKRLSSEDSLTSGSREIVIPSPSEVRLLREYNPWKVYHLFFSQIFFSPPRSLCQCHLHTAWSLISWRKRSYGPRSYYRDWTATSRVWKRAM